MLISHAERRGKAASRTPALTVPDAGSRLKPSSSIFPTVCSSSEIGGSGKDGCCGVSTMLEGPAECARSLVREACTDNTRGEGTFLLLLWSSRWMGPGCGPKLCGRGCGGRWGEDAWLPSQFAREE